MFGFRCLRLLALGCRQVAEDYSAVGPVGVKAVCSAAGRGFWRLSPSKHLGRLGAVPVSRCVTGLLLRPFYWPERGGGGVGWVEVWTAVPIASVFFDCLDAVGMICCVPAVVRRRALVRPSLPGRTGADVGPGVAYRVLAGGTARDVSRRLSLADQAFSLVRGMRAACTGGLVDSGERERRDACPTSGPCPTRVRHLLGQVRTEPVARSSPSTTRHHAFTVTSADFTRVSDAG